MDQTMIKNDFKEIKLSKDLNLSSVTIGIPKEFYPSGISSSNLEAWNDSLRLISSLSDNKIRLVDIHMPNVPYTMSCYTVLTSCEVASNFSRFDGLRYGHHMELSPERYTKYEFEEIVKKSRDESLGSVVKGRILSGNYFLSKE